MPLADAGPMSPDARRRRTAGLMAAQFNRPVAQDTLAQPMAPGTEVVDRGGLVPLGTYSDGRTGLAWPGFIIEPVQSFNRLLTQGYTSGDPQGAEDAFNVSGAAMLGGIAAPRPRGSIGMSGRPEGAALDMSHAARMQRAREMGYDTDTTWYHGTRSGGFAEFNPALANSSSKTGVPDGTMVFTSSPQNASTYAATKKGMWGDDVGYEPGASVMPVYLDGRTSDMVVDAKGANWRDIQHKNKFYDANELAQLAKDLAYEGLLIRNVVDSKISSGAQPADTYFKFSPEGIRSVNAAFDPAKADSTNILYSGGGRPGAATGAALNAAGERQGGEGLLNRLMSMFRGASAEPLRGYRGDIYAERRNPNMYWAATDPAIASDYAMVGGSSRQPGYSPNVQPAEFRFKNPLEIDAQGSSWEKVPSPYGTTSTDEIATLAQNAQHDGVVFRNVHDPIGDVDGQVGTTIAALKRGTVYSPMTGELLFANGGRPGAAVGQLLQQYGYAAPFGALPDYRDVI